MAKGATNASDAIWWPNLELMQVAFYLAGGITQVMDSIPWVHCASGNVFDQFSVFETRTRILYCYISQRNHILSIFFTRKFGEIFLLDPGIVGKSDFVSGILILENIARGTMDPGY